MRFEITILVLADSFIRASPPNRQLLRSLGKRMTPLKIWNDAALHVTTIASLEEARIVVAIWPLYPSENITVEPVNFLVP